MRAAFVVVARRGRTFSPASLPPRCAGGTAAATALRRGSPAPFLADEERGEGRLRHLSSQRCSLSPSLLVNDSAAAATRMAAAMGTAPRREAVPCCRRFASSGASSGALDDEGRPEKLHHHNDESASSSLAEPAGGAADSEPAEVAATAAAAIPGAQTGGRKLAVVFTCDVCQTRSAKQFTAQAYYNGVVLARCPGCQNLHLIADRLGYFSDKNDDGWDLQDAAASRGEALRHVTDVLELTPEDLLGRDKLDEIIHGLSGSDATAAAEGNVGVGGEPPGTT